MSLFVRSGPTPPCTSEPITSQPSSLPVVSVSNTHLSMSTMGVSCLFGTVGGIGAGILSRSLLVYCGAPVYAVNLAPLVVGVCVDGCFVKCCIQNIMSRNNELKYVDF